MLFFEKSDVKGEEKVFYVPFPPKKAGVNVKKAFFS